MYNDMNVFDTPYMDNESEISDCLLQMAGARVFYLDLGIPFTDCSYRVVFYDIEGDEDEHEYERGRGNTS